MADVAFAGNCITVSKARTLSPSILTVMASSIGTVHDDHIDDGNFFPSLI